MTADEEDTLALLADLRAAPDQSGNCSISSYNSNSSSDNAIHGLSSPAAAACVCCGCTPHTYDSVDPLEQVEVGAAGAVGAFADVTHLATGYFNVTQRYADALLSGGASPRTCIHVLTAAPSANGFFGSAGISGAIPTAYSEIERAFYKAAARAGRLHYSPRTRPTAPGIALYEYSRRGWTFHAKGLWRVRYSRRSSTAAASTPAACSSAASTLAACSSAAGATTVKTPAAIATAPVRLSDSPVSLPPPVGADATPTAVPTPAATPAAAPAAEWRVHDLVTLVGSPNFGQRSVFRDLELQVEIAVDGRASELVAAFIAERDALFGAPITTSSVAAATAVVIERDRALLGTPAPSSSSGSSSGNTSVVVDLDAQHESTASLHFPPSTSAIRDASQKQLQQQQQRSFPNLRPSTLPAAADASPTVVAVGGHLGPSYDVWSHPDRTLEGWTWARGQWIRLGRRVLAPFF